MDRVLRLREGDAVEVCDGAGRLLQAFIGGMTHANLAFAEAITPVQMVRTPQSGRAVC